MGNETSNNKENKSRGSIDETASSKSITHRINGTIPHITPNMTSDKSMESVNNNNMLLCPQSTLRSSTISSNLLPATPQSPEPLTPLTPLSPSINLTKSKSIHRRRKSSLLVVHNGITGKYISSRICKIAAKFWKNNIESLSVSEQLEIGCSIFFGMLSSNTSMKKIMKSQLNENKKIESTSLRYLDMMGWLIRYLITDNIDLYSLLTKLGIFHQNMGIKIEHFEPMLEAMHETFSYYFEHKYSIEVKYAIEEIFSLAAQLMTGQDLKCSSHLMDITQQFQGNDIPFLENLDVCLKSNIGKEYLYRYLAQTWCDEIAIFLQSLTRFKSLTSIKERFIVARDITKASIHPSAAFTLNLSYETRLNALQKMDGLKEKFLAKEQFEISTNFFAEVETEINKLIMDNHWIKFVESIEILHSKSFNVE